MRPALDAPIRTTAAVIDEILATGYPALIVFETPGCEPCQPLRPGPDQRAREFQGRGPVLRVPAASEGWRAARYPLSVGPTLHYCRDAGEHARIKGNPGGAALRAHLEYLLSGNERPDPAEGPRHTLEARFGARAHHGVWQPRALLGAGSVTAH